jgi:hypothetical protein
MTELLFKIENTIYTETLNEKYSLYQYTNNSVESCNGIISKFICGKYIDLL